MTDSRPLYAREGNFEDREYRPMQPGQLSRETPVATSCSVVIASTFTADSVQAPLRFWMKTLGISADIRMSPYAQLLQELLSPKSSLSQNTGGFNVLLIRLDDWVRDRTEKDVRQSLDHLRRTACELKAAVEVLQAKTGASTLVLICGTSSTLNAAYGAELEEIQRSLSMDLRSAPRVACWTHSDIVLLYPVAGYEDVRSDRLGHIPYTTEYFVAMATLLSRRIAVSFVNPRKVIAVDCDNTLWKGICGEDGVNGIEIAPAHLEFQKMLIRQHDAGMLLCLCSKNNPSDVDAILKNRNDMLLREDHLVAKRVNWNAKSVSLNALSRELDLSLDSFILIDDNAVECAEVRTHCPSVLTLQFPGRLEEVSHFLNHAWVFDRVESTEEAKLRTAMYKQNAVRAKALDESANLAEFIASLELRVDVTTMQLRQLNRVAELLIRTNQFNLTTIRRSADEIEALVARGGIECLVVHVRDRFGDYGLVGAVLFQREPSRICVDTFVVSCRVLGRGVEYRVVNELGRIARQEARGSIVLKYRRTSRNEPAWMFLNGSFRSFARTPYENNGELLVEAEFAIPADYAETLVASFSDGGRYDERGRQEAPAGAVPSQSSGDHWHETAYRLSRVSDIILEMKRSLSEECSKAVDDVVPRTPTEVALAKIWTEVLGVEGVGIYGNFFDLGGDSILAVQVLARIGSVLGLELSIHEFFDGPTVEEVATKLARASRSSLEIQRADRNGPLPLSWAQRRLWFIDQLEGGRAAYHIPLAIRFLGELHCGALRASLNTLVERHESLRTIFLKVSDEPAQEVLLRRQSELAVIDFTTRATHERERDVLQQAREELALGFDLSSGPLVRFKLCRLSERENVLLITMHHIVADGWSIGILMSELGVLYEAYREGRPNPLPMLPIQYADYALWQRQWLMGSASQAQLRYWKEHLQGAPEFLELPTDHLRPSVQSYEGRSVPVSIGSDITVELRRLSRRLNLTPAMTLYAAWATVLSKLSGQKDIVIGMPVANRPHPDLEGIVGFFVNTLALRVRLEDDPSVAEILQRAKEIMLAGYAHQEAPFEHVVEVLQPQRSLSHNPIFQVMFAFQNAPRATLQLSKLGLLEYDVPAQTSQFDLLLSLQESADEIVGSVNYATDLFDADTIERWMGYFKGFLSVMTCQLNVPISRLSLLSEDERQRVIELFNTTQVEFHQPKLIHELFEEQARRTPAAVAVVYEGQSLTYAELNARANRLARYLRSKGVQPDQLVAICVERSLEMVIGLVAVLKSGGAYVPLDPSHPKDRLKYVLEDSAPRILLMQEKFRDRVPAAELDAIALDATLKSVDQFCSENISTSILGLRADNLVYVIYTSGSTGRPKGIAMSHDSVANLIEWHRENLCAGEGTRVLQFAALSFDVAFQEIFSTLCTGGTLLLPGEEIRKEPRALLEYLNSRSIERLFVPPIMLHSLAECCETANTVPTSLKDVIAAGEKLHISPALVALFRRLNGCRLHNHYGPTETHVVTTFTSNGDIGSWPALPPIGKPISNTKIYILDDERHPVPVGVVGEIYVGGANVARGYLHRPELTVERFTGNAFSDDPTSRIYRTGDLGRWRSDGSVEYVGRNDDQVKLRGHRVELSEIETQLARHEHVMSAAAAVLEDALGQRRLVAYITPRPGSAPRADDLRAFLKVLLPEYMVPSAFVSLDQLPLTPNGKLDRRSLPLPELGAYASREYEPPRGESEEIVCGIWKDLLGVEPIGRQDDFFDLGGHSLLGSQMVARLQTSFSLEIPMRLLFEFPTVCRFAYQIDELRRRRLLDSISVSKGETEDLLMRVAAMSDERVQELLGELGMDGKR